MNKRLLLALYDRSGLGAYMPVDYRGHELEVEKHIEKFAELIVKECIKEIEFQYGGGNLMEDGVTHNPEWDNAVECVSAMIKQHFGVEE
jgi:hypothetical protein